MISLLWPFLLKYFAVLVCYYFISVPISQVCVKPNLRNERKIHLFLGMIILLFSISIATALFTTTFRSSNTVLLAFLVFTIYLFKLKASKINSIKINWFDLGSFLCIALLAFFFYYSFYFDKEYQGFIVANQDYFFYSNISEFIAKTGNESYYYDYVSSEAGAVNQYHFFELWLNVFFMKVSNNNGANSQVLLTYPLLISTYAYGLFSIFKSQKKGIRILFTFVAVLFTGHSYITELFKTNNLFSDMGMFFANVLIYPKFAVTYIILLPSIYFLLKGRPVMTLFGIILAGFINPTIMYNSVLVVLGMLALNPGNALSFNSRKHLFFSIFFFFALYFSFYAFNLKSSISIELPNSNEILDTLKTWPAIITKINIIGKTFLQELFLYSLCIMLYIFTYLQKNFNATFNAFHFLLLAFIYGVSVFGWSLIRFVLGSPQLYANLTSVYFNILFSLLTIFSIVKLRTLALTKIKHYLLLFALFVSAILSLQVTFDDIFNQKIVFKAEFSSDFYARVKKEFSNKSALVVAKNMDVYNPVVAQHLNPIANQSYLVNLFSKYSYTMNVYPEYILFDTVRNSNFDRMQKTFKLGSTQHKLYKKYHLDSLPYRKQINELLKIAKVKYVFTYQNDSLVELLENKKEFVKNTGWGPNMVILN